MKILAGIVLVIAVLWTGFVLFANTMKSAQTGPFIGGGTIVTVWIVAGVLTALALG